MTDTVTIKIEVDVQQLDEPPSELDIYLKQEPHCESEEEPVDEISNIYYDGLSEQPSTSEFLPHDATVPLTKTKKRRGLTLPRNQKRPEFTCPFCNKQFSQKNHMKTHIMIHKGIKPYACDICHQRFSNSGNLNAHRLIHTGDRPFTCTYCNKGFSRNSNLKVHIYTHTGERPYVCETCDKAFSDNSSLKRHMVTHSGTKSYACSVCDKAFLLRGALITHMRTHTGEKPYTCKVCLKGFSDGSVLKKHERTHSGEKPYRCGLCSKGFSQSFNLRRHVLTHGKVKARRNSRKLILGKQEYEKESHSIEMHDATLMPKIFKTEAWSVDAQNTRLEVQVSVDTNGTILPTQGCESE